MPDNASYPAYLLGAAGMTNLQRMTRIATEGLYGGDSRFRSIEAGKYLRDLLADRLIGTDKDVADKVFVPRIMEQYAQEILGQQIKDPGKGFSILDAYNNWADGTKSNTKSSTNTQTSKAKDIFNDGGDPGVDNSGAVGGHNYGGTADTGKSIGLTSPLGIALGTVSSINPATSLVSTIAQLAGKYGTAVNSTGFNAHSDNLDPHPNIGTNAIAGFNSLGETEAAPGPTGATPGDIDPSNPGSIGLA